MARLANNFHRHPHRRRRSFVNLFKYTKKKRVAISHFIFVWTSTFRAWECFFPVRVGRATWSIKRKLSNFHIRFWGVLGVVIVFIWKWMPIRTFVVYIQSYVHIYTPIVIKLQTRNKSKTEKIRLCRTPSSSSLVAAIDEKWPSLRIWIPFLHHIKLNRSQFKIHFMCAHVAERCVCEWESSSLFSLVS